MYTLTLSIWQSPQMANAERKCRCEVELNYRFDQPGLKEMTLKAIDILHTRSRERNTGFMLMSEAAVGS